MSPMMARSILADDVGDRASNVGTVILVVIGLVVFIAVCLVVGKVAHQLVEAGWPLWSSGASGLLVLAVGYIAGSSAVMTTGGAIMAASLGIAMFGYMMGG